MMNQNLYKAKAYISLFHIHMGILLNNTIINQFNFFHIEITWVLYLKTKVKVYKMLPRSLVS